MKKKSVGRTKTKGESSKGKAKKNKAAVSIRNPKSLSAEQAGAIQSSHQYSFFDNVYAVARLIPKGRVTSYGAIAKYLGSGRSARMVGYAMNAAHAQHPPVPAHRVLNRNGMLTGKHHFAGPDLMQQLLE